ncbi:crosslink repair DNA glycosylase YcaQ family protein [Galbitalea sp. SE-J8]|uniref:DNA glycosylase AlkZ-like family protein n=1 Tax=Galbitalea sp. SE-J8 TaxID=3054952 RepID=UPI00259CB0F4|nr:crosslink repair DNA glycosylase YcaQ family protein [Galbitalea sp. SE-J8]MDM4763148.1 crosslink repair DNA glycosylase YcaQ family protein [Galbitalea sp. SE-J8]
MAGTRVLTVDEARRLAVRAQLLDADRPTDVVEVAEQLGAIKIDPTAVIAPCEHTMLFSRIGMEFEPYALARAAELDRTLFEFDGTFRPMSLLPLMLPAMRRWPTRQSSIDWLAANDAFRRDVIARLRAEGPLLASDIPDTAQESRPPDGWSGSNQTGHMLEFLMRQGVVAVSGREGRIRRWDLAQRVYPADLPEYTDAEAAALRDERRLRAAGIAKQRSPWTPVGGAGVPVAIEGSSRAYRADAELLASLDDEAFEGRVAILNPYDGMLFDRPRLQEIFDFAYVLEQFKPKAQRVYGYFAHPVLLDDRFVALLDAEVDRKHEILRVTALHELLPLTDDERERIRLEIDDLADWLGVQPPDPW